MQSSESSSSNSSLELQQDHHGPLTTLTSATTLHVERSSSSHPLRDDFSSSLLHHETPIENRHELQGNTTTPIATLSEVHNDPFISPSIPHDDNNSHYSISPPMNSAASLIQASSSPSTAGSPKSLVSPFSSSSNNKTILMKSLFRKLIGMICIVAVVILWVLGGVVIQFIYGNMSYDKPFFVTYVSTNLFSIYLLGFVFMGSWRRPLVKGLKWLLKGLISLVIPSKVLNYFGMVKYSREDGRRRDLYGTSRVVIRRVNGYQKVESSSTSLESKEMSPNETALGVINYENSNREEKVEENIEEITQEGAMKKDGKGKENHQDHSGDVNVGKTFRLAVVVTFFWFFSNTAYNYALSYTSVASDTIISNTSCLFTFIFGLLIGVEKNFSIIRFFAILVTLSGVVLVTFSDASHNGSGAKKDTILGNMLSLLAAVGYGIYSSLLKKYEEGVSMAMMFGFVGILNLIFNWPILFILWGTSVEIFQAPSWKVFIAMVLNSLISAVFSDLLWALAVVLTSPVIATVGLTLTIPFAIICDMVFKSDFSAFNVMYAMGTVCVLIGFISVNISYYLPKRITKFDQPYFCSVPFLMEKITNCGKS
ncbi:hypothetical protein C9374_011689 [Naegleria lovaniensis]|uniref:EamA domain-containing protein n=1 Tax=Naegleria lovaniensis TaxID=51637 RepID=A0AA88KEM1_NAELO|nr:uncharacterized protein C9374_011689 [Naegleria lovaniensis]KAG2373804.1 hypothetical protein C9374_011689 [Naegleria lovaniensis]